MDNLFEENRKKENRGINKGFLIGGLIGMLIIAAIILLAMRRPSMEEQEAAVIAGALQPATPQFDEITKDIIIATDTQRTVQFSNALGGISMSITGNIRNKGQRVIDGLEVNVAVVDQFNQVLKEKKVLVVPRQQEQLGPGESIPITTQIDGFTRDDDRANIRWRVTAIRVPQ